MNVDARVALLIDTATSWGCGLIEGVHRYAQVNGNWSLHFEPVGKYEQYHLPRGWRGEGIIARVHSANIAEKLLASGLPVVNVSWFRHADERIPNFSTDVAAVGRLCAEYLMDLGLRHFGYCGSQWREGWHDALGETFAARIAQGAHDCRSFTHTFRRREERCWTDEIDQLGTWLRELPKPVGVLAMDAIRGREVIETCRLFDLAVPDEVAVLAGDYDRLCCSLSRPPLSSMDISAPSVGFEAAALLDRMIRGEAVQRPRASVVPGRITTRPSTDVLAIDDRELAKAIRFIRAEASRPIQVKDVLAQVVMSRRVLEKRFREVLGRTPAEEIRRVRVEMARHMIEDTDLALGQIAPRCGFEHAEMLTRAFHRERGETPSAYRRRAGHRAETGRQ